MRLTGEKYESLHWEQNHPVQEAIVTPDRIALDWVVEITCYTAVDGSAILFCDWHEKDSGRAGSWMCRLKPNKT